MFLARSLCLPGRIARTYVGRLERGESGVTVEALAAILAALGRLSIRILQALQTSGQAEDTEEASGLSPNGNPLPYPFGLINSWYGG